jgi:hypothetical protein
VIEVRDTYTISLPEQKTSLEKPRRRQNDNIKMDLK